MADTAPQVAYRQELVAGFEQRKSIFRIGANTVYEKTPGAASVTFAIADSGASEAVTRGTNGLIPSSALNLTQVACPLVEYHHKVPQTRYNVFAAQGDIRKASQDATISTINRKIDDLAIAALNTGTLTTGTAAAMSLTLLLKARAKLGGNDVGVDEKGKVFALISPYAYAGMTALTNFSSADFGTRKPLADSPMTMFDWLGMTFMVSNRIPNIGTSTEVLFMWHKDALGVAADSESLNVESDYNKEHDYYFYRASTFIGVKLLQDKGIMKINHDASAFV